MPPSRPTTRACDRLSASITGNGLEKQQESLRLTSRNESVHIIDARVNHDD